MAFGLSQLGSCAERKGKKRIGDVEWKGFASGCYDIKCRLAAGIGMEQIVG